MSIIGVAGLIGEVGLLLLLIWLESVGWTKLAETLRVAEMRQVANFGGTILLMALGLGFVLALRAVGQAPGDSVVVALLLLPALLYFVLSGRLTDFKGPGGLAMSFIRVSEGAVSRSTDTSMLTWVASAGEIQAVQKEGVPEIAKKISTVDPTKPLVLQVQIGVDQAGYTKEALLAYLHQLSTMRAFKLVAFVDANKKWLASGEPTTISWALTNEPTAGQLIQALNGQGPPNLAELPYLSRLSFRLTDSTRTVIEAMAGANTAVAVLLAPSGRIEAVVERDQLAASFLAAVLQGSDTGT